MPTKRLHPRMRVILDFSLGPNSLNQQAIAATEALDAGIAVGELWGARYGKNFYSIKRNKTSITVRGST